MIEFIKLFFSKTWEFFSIKWPGFDFTIGTAFLAVSLSVGALVAVMNMAGVSVPSSWAFRGGAEYGLGIRGGNNSNIKISKERKHDTR